VIKEVATPRRQSLATGFENGYSQTRDPPQNEVHFYQHTEPRPENTGFTFDGSNFNTQDLGQFWLWDIDPHMEDGASSYSGEDINRLVS
jgi:hypothetical protein